jgi:hypothetical protein
MLDLPFSTHNSGSGISFFFFFNSFRKENYFTSYNKFQSTPFADTPDKQKHVQNCWIRDERAIW